jgi:hypothetical protein
MAVAAKPRHKLFSLRLCGAYHLLTSQDPVTLTTAEDLIWHKQVPLKVSIFAWRLLRDRLPTKDNLLTRCIISSEAHFCVFGCGGIESTQHLLLTMVLLAPYGHRFGIGLVFLRWTLIHHLIICFSSLTQQVVVEHDGLFSSLFGLWVFEFCGTKEIIGYSIMRQKRYLNYWIKSKFTLFGCWRRQMWP